MELERQYSGERRKTMEATSNWSLMGRAIYKVRLISGREKRGGHGVIISPPKTPRFSGWPLKIRSVEDMVG